MINSMTNSMTNCVGNTITLVLFNSDTASIWCRVDQYGWCRGCANFLNYSGLQHNEAKWPQQKEES